MATATGAWPACESHDASSGAAEVDPGPTFGAEVTVDVVGRGRVTSPSGSIDCPAQCFTRVVVDEATVDGAEQGLVLTAEATPGAHFMGWKAARLELGVRARGPAQCSPMMRSSTAPPGNLASRFLTLPFGETIGKPPAGHEAECADVTAVPVAYALIATFEDDFAPRDAGPDAADGAGVEVVFEPPAGMMAQAKELGVVQGSLYWRFQIGDGRSGIAMGRLANPLQTAVVVPADQLIRLFGVDEHVVYERGSGLFSIPAGSATPFFLGSLAQTCDAVASDSTTVYCRAPNGTGSVVNAWPVQGGQSARLVHILPRGQALAVDDQTQRMFVTDESVGGAATSLVSSVPLAGIGGTPQVTNLTAGQTAPRSLKAGLANLFWIDQPSADTFVAVSGPKLTFGQATQGFGSTYLRFVAADPTSTTTYWAAVGSPGNAASQIVQINVGGGFTTFRSELTGVGGLAVDNAYVYWTQSNGRVYRARKLDFDL